MKRTFQLSLLGVAVALIATAFTYNSSDEKEFKSLAIGELAPNLHQKLKDVSGKEMMLREMGQENGLLVIFSCNTCPFVIAWEDRYNELFDLCSSNKIGMVLVNSNEAKRDGADSFEAMKKKAAEEGYKSMYVVDKNAELADAFGARTTPHVYLFDNQFKLSFVGAIDDNYESRDGVSKTYLRDAINNTLAGKSIDPAETTPKGCSIKRVKR
ncbi:MAG: redoxin domain-containing protein [Salibacteraceae bacterium]